MGKSKRNTPKPTSNRAARAAAKSSAALPAAPSRPFAGLAGECDLVAMREFVPSATALLPVRAGIGPTPVVLSTVLPGAVAALAREESGATVGYVAVQVQHPLIDPAQDLSGAIEWAATAPSGASLEATPAVEHRPLAELIDPEVALDIAVHNDFNWWMPAGFDPAPEVAQTVARANEAIMPSARLSGVNAAWWVNAGAKAHLRWVRPEAEDALMLALARVHADGQLHLGDGSRFAGSFRTHGLLVPVFDLDPERHPQEWVEAARELDQRLGEALAVTEPLTPAQRRARDGLRGRQITLR